MFALAVGQKFERYRVIRLLGSGISGTTYEAEDIMLHRKVALKLIHPWSILPDSARRQFFRHMQSFSLLTHPYQAATLDYGEADGQLYTVTRFMTAGSLLNDEGRRWFSPPLRVKDAISYTYQIAQTLYNLHRYGYVHGSLTLSNILVVRSTNFDNDPDFAPFLLADVGMGYFVRRFGHPKISRQLITDAPEQARGRVIAASDQYALAVLVYLWLAGQPPFLGSPEEIENAKRNSAIPRLATQNAHITFEQEGIIQRALSGYPDDRYPTILAFAEALRASLARSDQPSTTEDSARRSYPITTEPLNQFLPSTMSKALSADKIASEFTEDEIVISTGNHQQSTEQISSSFVLDQQELLRFTAIAKQEPLTPEPQPNSVHPSPEIPKTSSLESKSESAPVQTPLPKSIPQSGLDTSQSIPVPMSLPMTPGLSILIEQAEEAHTSTMQTEPLPTSTGNTNPSSVMLIITFPSTQNTREFTLQQQETTIGRAGSSDILLDQDTLTSRHHALVKYEDQRYLIYDCRSANGVTINGQQITPEIGCPLSDGDQIQIGEYRLLFRHLTSQSLPHTSTEHAMS